MNNFNDSPSFIPVYKSTCFMHKVILKNDLYTLKLMLSDGRRDCLNDLDHSGRTPFHVALQTANPKALYLLLYYPLLHTSKMFATLDWNKFLDSLYNKVSSEPTVSEPDPKTEKDSSSSLSILKLINSIFSGISNDKKTNKYKQLDSLESQDPKAPLEALLSKWENNPSEYVKSFLSLDERNQVNGCNIKEVQSLYDEHYKFLIGESHNLETAVKNYAKKFLSIYSDRNHRKRSTDSSPVSNKDRSGYVSPTKSLSEKNDDLSLEKNFNSTDDLNCTNTSNYSDMNRYLELLKSKDSPQKTKVSDNLSSESPDKVYKGLLPVETVDLISTFDKTSPLHLLFSNVYISSYRTNMLKCFRILIYYFNKIDDFQDTYNYLDYILYFSSFSVNKCLEMYWSSLLLSQKYKKEFKNENLRNKHGVNCKKGYDLDLKSKDSDLKSQSYENNNKRELDEDSLHPKRPKTDFTNNNSKVSNFPNMTLCEDASQMSQKRDKRSFTLLNSRNSSSDTQSLYPNSNKLYFDRDLGHEDSSINYKIFEESDIRTLILHRLMTHTSNWLVPYVSWETFVKKPDFSRSTILHRVCNLKDQNLVRLVLGCGFSPAVVNEAGDMPVHLSVDAKDPYSFLVILHATLKSLFYARFSPYNNSTATELLCNSDSSESSDSNMNFLNSDFSFKSGKLPYLKDRFLRYINSEEPKNTPKNKSNEYLNEFFNMYMAQMCIEFFKNKENIHDKFYKKIDIYSFNSLLSSLDLETRKVILDEFLMLFEQLIYRCIKSSAWECLIALLSYNSCLSYHLVSNPFFMHRFINYAHMTNNSNEFINVVEFTIINVLFDDFNDKETNCTSMSSNKTTIQSKDTLKNLQSKSTIKGDTFKGCGIPHSGLRPSMNHSNRSFATYHVTCFDEDPIIYNFIRSYKSKSDLIYLKIGSVTYVSRSLKTWIITHPTCLHHLATPEPTDAPNKRHRLIVTYPENPTRLEVIISNDNGILRSDTLENVKLIYSPPPASLADILRVHDWGYIDKLLEQVQFAQKRWATHPYWPVLADGDTPVTPHSWSAALYAAGSVLTAVDSVCTNQCKNAFCAVRPPGHHLGTWGAAQSNNFEDEDFAAGSQGFCLINNVAIGAAYAKYMYSTKGIRRIAIIDFDVHHGNGTEQVVRNTGPKEVKLLINTPGELYTTQYQQQIIQKKWFGWRDENDRDEILFASIHAYDGVFYPGTGQQCTMYQQDNKPNIINVAVPQGTTSSEFRLLFETKICPYVYHFKPDIIFISAGFDGHYRDSVSYGFTKYTEKDFNYVTEKLINIANTVCEGRVVSVLEGGYNTKLNTLSPFARSVLEHVTALCNTNKNTTYPFMYGEHSINYLLTPVVKSLEGKVVNGVGNNTNVSSVNSTTSNNTVQSPTSPTNTKSVTFATDSTVNTPTSSSTNKKSEGSGSLISLINSFGCGSSIKNTRKKGNSEIVFGAYKLRMKTELLLSKTYSRHENYCNHSRLVKFDKTQMCCKSVFEICGNQYLSFYSKFFYTLFGVSHSPFIKSPFYKLNENPLDVLEKFLIDNFKNDDDENMDNKNNYGDLNNSNYEDVNSNNIQNTVVKQDVDNESKFKELSTSNEETVQNPDDRQDTEFKVPGNVVGVTSYYNMPSENVVNELCTDQNSQNNTQFKHNDTLSQLNTSEFVSLDCADSGSFGEHLGDFLPESVNDSSFQLNNNGEFPDVMEFHDAHSQMIHFDSSFDELSLNNGESYTNVSQVTQNDKNKLQDDSVHSTELKEELLKGDVKDNEIEDKKLLELNDSFVKLNEHFKKGEDLDEDIDEIIVKLKALKDVDKSNEIISTYSWLANLKMKSLEQNYKVATDLDAFYVKFGKLFVYNCHIHT